MGTWIVVDGTRYEAVPLERLTLMQVARAARETGLTPERMEQVMRLKVAGGLDDEVDQLLASAIMVWAARVAAGEHHPTVESAQVPLDRLDWVNDDEEDEGADPTTLPTPTPPGSDSEAAGAGEPEPPPTG